jgi:hypothetical protein
MSATERVGPRAVVGLRRTIHPGLLATLMVLRFEVDEYPVKLERDSFNDQHSEVEIFSQRQSIVRGKKQPNDVGLPSSL